MKPKKVYIAGPMYSSGDMDNNIRMALEAATRLRRAGFLPFIPHLYFFWNLMSPQPRDHWMGLDLDWVRDCDCLLQLPGYSEGATIEVEVAIKNQIPVYDNIDELIQSESNYRNKI